MSMAEALVCLCGEYYDGLHQACNGATGWVECIGPVIFDPCPFTPCSRCFSHPWTASCGVTKLDLKALLLKQSMTHASSYPLKVMVNLHDCAGLGPSAGKAWRVGLMGYNAQNANVELVLRAFQTGLHAQGWKSRDD